MNTKKVFELIEEIESNLNALKEELEGSNLDSLYEYEEITPYVDDDVEYYDPSEEI
jgi:hypothetical protein